MTTICVCFWSVKNGKCYEFAMLPGQTLDAHAVNLRIGEPHLDVDALYVLKGLPCTTG